MYSNVYIVNVACDLIAGTHSITEEDLGLPKGTLPPKKLATLGSIYTVKKELLDVGKALRRKTKRLLAAVGVGVGQGTVVTPSDLSSLMTDLEAVRKEFYDWKDTVLSSFDDELDNWVAENAEYGDLIKRYAPDIKRVERRLAYSIDVVKLAVPEDDDPHADVLKSTLTRSGNDISKRLKVEIASFVSEFHEASFQKTKKLVKQSLGALRRTLLPKIQSFAMLDSTLRPVWQYLESFIDDVSSAIDAQPKGQRFIDGPALDPFEVRIKELMTTSSIEALIANAPASPQRQIVNAPPEQPTKPSMPRPAPVPPKRPSVAPPSPPGEREIRPIRF